MKWTLNVWVVFCCSFGSQFVYHIEQGDHTQSNCFAKHVMCVFQWFCWAGVSYQKHFHSKATPWKFFFERCRQQLKGKMFQCRKIMHTTKKDYLMEPKNGKNFWLGFSVIGFLQNWNLFEQNLKSWPRKVLPKSMLGNGFQKTPSHTGAGSQELWISVVLDPRF